MERTNPMIALKWLLSFTYFKTMLHVWNTRNDWLNALNNGSFTDQQIVTRNKFISTIQGHSYSVCVYVYSEVHTVYTPSINRIQGFTSVGGRTVMLSPPVH